ncbi:MAG: hypothetical protein WCK98_06865 [bacterium]
METTDPAVLKDQNGTTFVLENPAKDAIPILNRITEICEERGYTFRFVRYDNKTHPPSLHYEYLFGVKGGKLYPIEVQILNLKQWVDAGHHDISPHLNYELRRSIQVTSSVLDIPEDNVVLLNKKRSDVLQDMKRRHEAVKIKKK